MKLKLIIGLLLLGAVGYQVYRNTSSSPGTNAGGLGPGDGQRIELRFTSVDGREVDLDKLRGKVVLIDFWATWCGPCMAALPHVREAYEQFHAQGLEVVGISFDKDKQDLMRVIGREKMAWPQYFDPDGRYGQKFGINVIPTMWLLDKSGAVRDRNAREDLTGKVKRLLAEATPTSTPGVAQSDSKDITRVEYKRGEPLQLRFKALDGREVDLEKMRGRVVLIDFWATWCGPCMEEVPHVKAAYEQLREQGFEVVGISLDQDQATLKRVVAKEKMTWPQYFEASGKDNRIAAALKVEEIPTMWLVDRKGFLRESKAHEDLLNKARRLLDEKGSLPAAQTAPAAKKSATAPVAGVATAQPPQTGTATTPNPGASEKPAAKPVSYLKLKGVSGTASRRFATVDSSLQSYVFKEGQTLSVRTPAGSVKVKCTQITESGAQFEVEGEAQPLRLELP